MYSEKKSLTRSSSDKVIAGVLSGIAEYYNLNTTWLRIGVLLASFFTAGAIIIGYIAAAIIIPRDSND